MHIRISRQYWRIWVGYVSGKLLCDTGGNTKCGKKIWTIHKPLGGKQ